MGRSRPKTTQNVLKQCLTTPVPALVRSPGPAHGRDPSAMVGPPFRRVSSVFRPRWALVGPVWPSLGPGRVTRRPKQKQVPISGGGHLRRRSHAKGWSPDRNSIARRDPNSAATPMSQAMGWSLDQTSVAQSEGVREMALLRVAGTYAVAMLPPSHQPKNLIFDF